MDHFCWDWITRTDRPGRFSLPIAEDLADLVSTVRRLEADPWRAERMALQHRAHARRAYNPAMNWAAFAHMARALGRRL